MVKQNRQIKTSLNVWKRRNVTFQGKTLIIKSYIVSSILFEMEARGIPQKHVNTLDMLIKYCVGDNKQQTFL